MASKFPVPKTFAVQKTEEQWRADLSPEDYRVLRNKVGCGISCARDRELPAVFYGPCKKQTRCRYQQSVWLRVLHIIVHITQRRAVEVPVLVHVWCTRVTLRAGSCTTAAPWAYKYPTVRQVGMG